MRTGGVAPPARVVSRSNEHEAEAAFKHAIARTRGSSSTTARICSSTALLVALIAIVAIGAVATVGNTIYSVFWKSIETAF